MVENGQLPELQGPAWFRGELAQAGGRRRGGGHGLERGASTLEVVFGNYERSGGGGKLGRFALSRWAPGLMREVVRAIVRKPRRGGSGIAAFSTRALRR